MIEADFREPSISLQYQYLNLSWSSFYYAPRPIGPEDLELMRLVDEQYLITPFFGSRSMAQHFRRQGRKFNLKRIRRLMRLMRIEVVDPKPHTSRPIRIIKYFLPPQKPVHRSS
jgi:putative transposase